MIAGGMLSLFALEAPAERTRAEGGGSARPPATSLVPDPAPLEDLS
jgi:hypothetical protein